MNKCEQCGSYAINHHCHGRDGSDPDLCDVCYWRKRASDALEAASLPVGVPDNYMPIPTAEQLAEALNNVGCFHDMSAELIAPELLANLLAAEQSTTDKQSLTVAEQSAQGEVEEFEVVAYIGRSARMTGEGWEEGPEYSVLAGDATDADKRYDVPLMTVAKHKRIVAQLAARDAGVVRVPVELLTILASEGLSETESDRYVDAVMDARALLAQRERGGE